MGEGLLAETTVDRSAYDAITTRSRYFCSSQRSPTDSEGVRASGGSGLRMWSKFKVSQPTAYSQLGFCVFLRLRVREQFDTLQHASPTLPPFSFFTFSRRKKKMKSSKP